MRQQQAPKQKRRVLPDLAHEQEQARIMAVIAKPVPVGGGQHAIDRGRDAVAAMPVLVIRPRTPEQTRPGTRRQVKIARCKRFAIK